MATVSSPTFESLRDKCLKEGTLYKDPDFPAEAKSIYQSKTSKSISWKRPPEINKNCQFVVDGHSRFDLDQGELGNCWFVAAAATLATKPELLRNVVPVQNFKDQYAGIFHFFFWRYGDWQEVIIDDFLPVKYGKQLAFCHNKEQPDEFWSALLEKAYAKLNGSYEALLDGKIQDALVDFTGGVSEVLELASYTKTSEELFNDIKRYDSFNSLMGCSISRLGMSASQPCNQGLYSSHAYSITCLKKISVEKKDISLIRILNPWGKVEWTGDWSDSSPLWDKVAEKTKEDLHFRKLEDGEFWMSFEEWRQTFTQLQLCHLTLDSINQRVKAWSQQANHGRWIKGINAGGCGTTPNEASYWKNPQYGIILKSDDAAKKSTIIISLMQKSKREVAAQSAGGTKIIGYRLFRVNRNEPPHIDNSIYPKETSVLDDRYNPIREVAQTYVVEPGSYCIIPTTYLPNEEAEFLLRVLTKQKADLSVLEDKLPSTESSSKVSSKSGYGKAVEIPATVEDDDDDSGKKKKKSPVVDLTDLIQSEIDADIRAEELAPVAPPKKEQPKRQSTAADRKLQEIYDSVTGQLVDSIDACDVQQMLVSVSQSNQLGNYGIRFSVPDCRIFLNLIDNSLNRKLTFEQFQELVSMLQKWLKAFAAVDKDEEGLLSYDEIWNIFSTLGFELESQVKETIALSFGSRKYGLQLSDFINCLAKISQVRKLKGDKKRAMIKLDERLRFVLLT